MNAEWETGRPGRPPEVAMVAGAKTTVESDEGIRLVARAHRERTRLTVGRTEHGQVGLQGSVRLAIGLLLRYS